MPDNNLTAPILFIIFSRPDVTQKVFDRIKLAKPAKLYVAADGPRKGNVADKEKCAETRNLVLNNIDWDCEVITLLRDENLGCRNAVSQAISWFFDQEEMGIILEDDCLPDISFFKFCQECLLKYKDDDRFFHINGSNYQLGWQRDADYPYYFTKYNSIWGWASWRRAWKFYDVNIPNWPEIKEKRFFLDMSNSEVDALNRMQIFDSVYNKKVDTWDYQWTFTIMSQSGICITPNKNLISNIGFGEGATHTTKPNKRANLPVESVKLPLNHPKFVIVDAVSDKRLYQKFGKRGWIWRFKNLAKLIELQNKI